MAEYNISSWDIRELKGGLNSLHNAVSHFSESIQMIQSEVQRVNGRVDSVYRQIDLLTMDFHEFVGMQKKRTLSQKLSKE